MDDKELLDPHADVELNTDTDVLLDNMQLLRLKILKGGGEIDKTQLQLINDLTNTALTLKKIKVDDTNAKDDRVFAARMVEFLRNVKNNPFEVDGNTGTVISPTVPDYDFVEGETATVFEALELDEVMSAPDLIRNA